MQIHPKIHTFDASKSSLYVEVYVFKYYLPIHSFLIKNKTQQKHKNKNKTQNFQSLQMRWKYKHASCSNKKINLLLYPKRKKRVLDKEDLDQDLDTIFFFFLLDYP